MNELAVLLVVCVVIALVFAISRLTSPSSEPAASTTPKTNTSIDKDSQCAVCKDNTADSSLDVGKSVYDICSSCRDPLINTAQQFAHRILNNSDEFVPVLTERLEVAGVTVDDSERSQLVYNTIQLLHRFSDEKAREVIPTGDYGSVEAYACLRTYILHLLTDSVSVLKNTAEEAQDDFLRYLETDVASKFFFATVDVQSHYVDAVLAAAEATENNDLKSDVKKASDRLLDSVRGKFGTDLHMLKQGLFPSYLSEELDQLEKLEESAKRCLWCSRDNVELHYQTSGPLCSDCASEFNSAEQEIPPQIVDLAEDTAPQILDAVESVGVDIDASPEVLVRRELAALLNHSVMEELRSSLDSDHVPSSMPPFTEHSTRVLSSTEGAADDVPRLKREERQETLREILYMRDREYADLDADNKKDAVLTHLAEALDATPDDFNVSLVFDTITDITEQISEMTQNCLPARDHFTS